jgi:hypothetical protein
MRLSLGAALLTGCLGGVPVSPPPECRSDFHCPLDAICANGSCVKVPRGASYHLALTPPNDSPYPKQHALGVRVSATLNTVPDLFLQSGSVFAGHVLVEGSADVLGLRARVEISRSGDIPGTVLRASAATAINEPSQRQRFRFVVAPGTYSVTAFLEDPLLPPIVSFDSVDLASSLEKDLVLPPIAALRRISGAVVRAEGTRAPVGNVTVQAFDASGVTTSGPTRTLADGRFVIYVLPTSSQHTVRVWRGAEGPRIPTVERAVSVSSSAVDVGFIAVGPFEPPVLVSARVIGKIDTGESAPVAGALVTLSGEVGPGTWTESATTDTRGELRIEIPPGRYSVEIRPPLESELASKEAAIIVTGHDDELVLTLERKSRLSGVVTAPQGGAAAGVLVQASRRASAAGSTTTWRYQKMTTTDDKGRYELRLDPGLYDLSFVPEGLPFARADLTSLSMRNEDRTFDQRLPDGVVLAGILRDPTGRALGGVAVEVYEPGERQSRLVGAGATQTNGQYRIVIPAPSPAASP